MASTSLEPGFHSISYAIILAAARACQVTKAYGNNGSGYGRLSVRSSPQTASRICKACFHIQENGLQKLLAIHQPTHQYLTRERVIKLSLPLE